MRYKNSGLGQRVVKCGIILTLVHEVLQASTLASQKYPPTYLTIFARHLLRYRQFPTPWPWSHL